MIPFAGILCVQMLMFATLSTVGKISDINFNNHYENDEEKTGSEIMFGELFDTVMIIFGYKSKMEEGRAIQWAMLILYSFLVYIVNIKLLISILGETYSKMQVTRVAMSYQITTGALVEIARFRFWERSESFAAKNEENL